jgi:predicted nucleotidyltransferase
MHGRIGSHPTGGSTGNTLPADNGIPWRAPPYLCLMDFFAPYMERITELCRQHQVKSLHAFGSAVKGELRKGSDIDLLVDIESRDPIEYGEHYFELLFALENLFERPIDLLEKRTLSNRYFKAAIDAHKRPLYDA